LNQKITFPSKIHHLFFVRKKAEIEIWSANIRIYPDFILQSSPDCWLSELYMFAVFVRGNPKILASTKMPFFV